MDPFALLDRLDGGGDAVLSPYGVRRALDVVRGGARGETRAALDEVLGPDETPALSADGLALAQAAWLADGYAPGPALNGFHAGRLEVDAINAWASEKTNGMIPSVIDSLKRNEAFALTDAIYLDAKWHIPFQRIGPRPFEGAGEVEMMTVEGTFEHAKDAIRLPYGDGDLRFVARLDPHDHRPPAGRESPAPAGRPATAPTAGAAGDPPSAPAKGAAIAAGDPASAPARGAAIAAGDPELASAALGTARQWDAVSWSRGRGTVVMPVFSAESRHDLGEALSEEGLAPAFVPGRDLEDLFHGPGEKALSRILQRARVDVDDVGTRAAAVTVVTARAVSAVLGPPPFHLTFDRPFTWAIEHAPTGTLLFVGRVRHPRERSH
jgi:serine protease inhibitor